MKSFTFPYGRLHSRTSGRMRSSVALAVLALLAGPCGAALVVQSAWRMGEPGSVDGSSRPLDSISADGELNPFNNGGGLSVLTADPAPASGSTAYLHTAGAAFNGTWMFGAGSDNQNIPSDNWGVEFMVRSTDTASITGTDFRSIFSLGNGVSGQLAVEARRHTDGNVYWDVNRQGLANLIIPRDARTLVVDNTWFDLAVVKAGGTLNFYVDGVHAGSSADPTVNDGLIHLGIQAGVGNKNFIGDYDEGRFFTFNAGEFTPSMLLVPEPGTCTLAALALLFFQARRRRRPPHRT